MKRIFLVPHVDTSESGTNSSIGSGKYRFLYGGFEVRSIDDERRKYWNTWNAWELICLKSLELRLTTFCFKGNTSSFFEFYKYFFVLNEGNIRSKEFG